MFKELSVIEFHRLFKNENDCKIFLSELKWGKGYQCRKCSHSEYSKGRTMFYRRCKQCGYDESVTSNSIFHKNKIGLLKTFIGIFEMVTSKKGIASTTLSDKIMVNNKTSQLLRRKMQFCMKDVSGNLFKENVEVDEFSIGGHSKGNPGRSINGKKHVIVALEFNNQNRNTRAATMPLRGFKTEDFKEIFQLKIHTEANIMTDGFKSYLPLKEIYVNLDSKLSDKGKNFEDLHLFIFNLKNWLRATHHHCSTKYLKSYLDEFIFRFNNRGGYFRKNIFKTVLTSAAFHLPLTSVAISTLCELNG
jgi:transposase-like protein